MKESTIFFIIIFINGVIIGSFLNVCIYIISDGLSIAAGGINCLKCRSKFNRYELIPITSLIFLLGLCRYCKSKISIRYPAVEILNGFLYVLVFYFNGFATLWDILISFTYCMVISALIVLSLIDLRTKTIPLGFNIFIAVMGLLTALIKFYASGKSFDILISHAVGLISVSIILLLIYCTSHGRGIGGGDIKLMAASGIVLGASQNFLAFFIGCILAAIIHPIRMKIKKLDNLLAFGPYLSAGIVISMLFGRQIIDWYIESFLIF